MTSLALKAFTRTLLLLLAVLPLISVAAVAPQDEEPRNGTADRTQVSFWIDELGHSSLRNREEAFFQLQLLGADARPHLAKALDGADLQVAHAIRYLLDHEPLRQDMVPVPAGTYGIGSGKDTFANPRRSVKLDAFRIDRYETTQFMYYVFVRSTGHPAPPHWRNGRYSLGRENLPVCGITFDDARAFAEWAGKRLPTEEEWEAAARGTDGRLFPWGDRLRRGIANIDGLSLQEAGSYPMDVSFCECNDLAGNASEWVAARDTAGKEVPSRKGAAFNVPLKIPVAACAFRSIPLGPDVRHGELGFRCVKDAAAER